MIATVSPALRPFRPRDLRRQVLLQHASVSPDGEWVAYSRRTIEGDKYRSRLWRVPLRGGRPEQLTFADTNDVLPRFSPRGDELVFLSDRSERFQPWILPLGGGEPRQAPELQGHAVSASWSPDGRSLLVIAPSGEQRFVVGDPEAPLARRIRDLTWRLDGFGLRDQFHSAWVVPLGAGKPRRLTSPSYEVAEAAWAGNRVAFLADPRDEAGVIEYPQLHTGRGARRQRAAGPAAARPRHGRWPSRRAAGSRSSATTTPDPIGWENLGLFVVEGRNLRRLDEEPRPSGRQPDLRRHGRADGRPCPARALARRGDARRARREPRRVAALQLPARRRADRRFSTTKRSSAVVLRSAAGAWSSTPRHPATRRISSKWPAGAFAA